MTEFPQIVGLDEPLGLEPLQDPAAPLPDLHPGLEAFGLAGSLPLGQALQEQLLVSAAQEPLHLPQALVRRLV